MDEQEIRNRIVRKMLKNQIVGGHKKQVNNLGRGGPRLL
jgi:hypothetical protein